MDGAEPIKKAYEAILKGDFEEAVARFREAIALEPDNAAYHYKLSITCLRSNKHATALEHAREALRLAPEDASYAIHYDRLLAKENMLRAEAAMRQGGSQLYLAQAMLREACRLDPLAVEAKLLLAYACGELEDYNGAIAVLREADRLHPQHADVARLLQEYSDRIRQMLGSG